MGALPGGPALPAAGGAPTPGPRPTAGPEDTRSPSPAAATVVPTRPSRLRVRELYSWAARPTATEWEGVSLQARAVSRPLSSSPRSPQGSSRPAAEGGGVGVRVPGPPRGRGSRGNSLLVYTVTSSGFIGAECPELPPAPGPSATSGRPAELSMVPRERVGPTPTGETVAAHPTAGSGPHGLPPGLRPSWFPPDREALARPEYQAPSQSAARLASAWSLPLSPAGGPPPSPPAG